MEIDSKIIRLLVLVILLWSPLPYAATLVWENDAPLTSLLGADNIIINGNSYDVRFAGGSCIELFDGCNESSDFIFTSAQAARDASEALHQQVFSAVESSSSDPYFRAVDLQPLLISGIDSNEVGNIITPFSVNVPFPFVKVDVFRNIEEIVHGPNITFEDAIFATTEVRLIDTDIVLEKTYAVWSVSSVPIPAAVWLFGSGLLSLVGLLKYGKVATVLEAGNSTESYL